MGLQDEENREEAAGGGEEKTVTFDTEEMRVKGSAAVCSH